jgi:hypothetical protein
MIKRIAFIMIALATPVLGGEQFITSYWYGPPPKFTTLERYREIKEANFNVVFPAGGTMTVGENRRLLDICTELGLKAVIADARMPTALKGDARARLDAIVHDYADHPALLAYYVIDEPSAGAFADLGEVVAYLKQHDPEHPGYINLFPTYATPGAQLGAETYEKYVAQFVQTVRPFVISYDHYPFIQQGDRPDFFQNLAIVRNASIKSGLPFWNIVLCVQHYEYRALTEPELRFQAMQTLAFGGRGLLWYTYWYPGEPNPTVKHAMINYDGSRDPHYEMIKRINADAIAMGNELLEVKSWATFHAGDGATLQPPAQTPITSHGPGMVTIGIFKHAQGRTLAIVANRNYRDVTTTTLKAPLGRVEQFDRQRRLWIERKDLNLDLPPGDAVLLRW